MDSDRLTLSEIITGIKEFWWASQDPGLKIFRCSFIINFIILFFIFSNSFNFFSTMGMVIVLVSLSLSYGVTAFSTALLDFYIEKKFITNSQNIHEVLDMKDKKFHEWSNGITRVKVSLLSVMPIWGVLFFLTAIPI